MTEFRQNLSATRLLLERLKDDPARGVKAYSLGVASTLAEIDGVVLPDYVLESAATCETIGDAVSLYRKYSSLRQGKEPA